MKDITFLIGIPGSGKSTLTKEKFSNKNGDLVVINADSVRKRLYGDENIQGDGAKVFSEVYKTFREALTNDSTKSIVIDNTNVNFKTRKQYYKLIKEHCLDDYKIKLIFFTNFELAKQRNKNRERVVPEEVLDKMISNFQMPNEWEEYNCRIEFVEN